MLLLVLPLIVANVLAAVAPVRSWPPYGRRLLLAGDAVMMLVLFLGALAPVPYDEWGMGAIVPRLCLLGALLIFASALPLAKKSFYRPRP